MKKLSTVIAAAFALALAGQVQAKVDHAGFLTGPFKTGPEVTKKCLECHEKQAKDFMKTAHWTWSEEQKINGKKVAIGKKNILNNFCIALPGNWPRCTSCHAGYGWKDGTFDFTKAENVDCLVCHDTTGTYKKLPTGAGHPAYEGEGKVDLVKVAQSVGAPSRATCGACHFYGGGGDHIKHGDLDSSLTNPTPDIDVHMGRGMTCQSCHKTKNHAIPGESIFVSPGDGMRVQCVDCHKAAPHKNAALNRHAKKVACQTCHTPTIAKALPTKVWWDWSTAGKDVKDVPKDQYGQKLYDKMKGDFKWDKDFAPVYYWYNGKTERLLPGDKFNPKKQPIWISKPVGSKKDPKAKLTPFKIMAGKQPYDSVNNYLVYIGLFGKDHFWKTYDWNQSIASGMKAGGLPYSGKFDFVETKMVWKVNHMVAPKDKALKCDDCHGAKGRLDWKALGYKGDPKKK